MAASEGSDSAPVDLGPLFNDVGDAADLMTSAEANATLMRHSISPEVREAIQQADIAVARALSALGRERAKQPTIVKRIPMPPHIAAGLRPETTHADTFHDTSKVG